MHENRCHVVVKPLQTDGGDRKKISTVAARCQTIRIKQLLDEQGDSSYGETKVYGSHCCGCDRKSEICNVKPLTSDRAGVGNRSSEKVAQAAVNNHYNCR